MPIPQGVLAPALRRHWTKSVSCVAAVALLTLVSLQYLRPHYVSEARLAVSLQDSPASPPVTSGELQQIAQDIGSPARMARVVDALGAGNLVPDLRAKDAPGRRQEAIDRLRGSLQVTATAQSGEITIRGVAQRPERAQQMVAVLVSSCMHESPRLARAAALPPAAGNERAQLEEAWKVASSHLQLVQGSAEDASIAGQRKLIEDQLAEVELQLIRELSRHEAEERRLESQLTPAHPQLLALRELIGELSRQIGDSGSKPGQASEQQTPGAVGKLCTRREELRLELAALQQREGRLAKAAQRSQEVQAQLAQHSRQEELLRAKTEDRDRSIQLSVIAPASPARPRGGISRMLAVALGIGFGVIGAIGLPLLCYRSNPSLMTCRDIACELELPVAGPIPTASAPLDVAV